MDWSFSQRVLVAPLVFVLAFGGPAAALATASTSTAPSAPLSGSLSSDVVSLNSQCTDWSASLASFDFNRGVAEFIEQHASVSPDEGCLNRVGWQLSEVLFSQGDLYALRMEKINKQYLHAKQSGRQTEMDAIDDLVVVLQHRWLTEMYSSLMSTRSKAMVAATSGGVALAALAIAGALVFKSNLLKSITSKARSANIRMVRYLGGYLLETLVSRTASHDYVSAPKSSLDQGLSSANRSEAEESDFVKRFREPPMNYVKNGGGTYLGYSDLSFARDMASQVASAAGSVAIGYGAKIAMIKVLAAMGQVGTQVGAVLSPSVVFYAASFAAAHYITKWTTEAVRDEYYRRLAKSIDAAEEGLSNAGLNDWERSVQTAKYVSLLIQWSSLQTEPLEESLNEEILSYKRSQICSRLTLKLESDPELSHWPRKVATQQNFFVSLSERGEKRLRANVLGVMNAARPRITPIQERIIKGIGVLKAQNKAFVRPYLQQLQILANRIEFRMSPDIAVRTEIEHVRALSEDLAPGRVGWQETDKLKALAEALSCAR